MTIGHQMVHCAALNPILNASFSPRLIYPALLTKCLISNRRAFFRMETNLLITNLVWVVNQPTVSLSSSWDVVGGYFFFGLQAGLFMGLAWWIAFITIRTLRGPRLPWSHE